MTLPALQTTNGAYSLLELDYGPQLADLLDLDLTTENGVEITRRLLQDIANSVSSNVSGLVLDHIYSYPIVNSPKLESGVIFRLEQENTVDPLSLPSLLSNWGVENIKENYGAAKIELYYHPLEEKALEKKQLIAELYDYCQHEKIAFILKLVIYDPTGDDVNISSFQEIQLESINEFSKSADLLILQYPQDALESATITAGLDIPWVSMLEGVDYETFKDSMRVAIENGAKGFLIGQALWQEIGDFKLKDGSPDFEKIDQFIKNTLRDRMIELNRIADELALG